jgi:hypothetical protein
MRPTRTGIAHAQLRRTPSTLAHTQRCRTQVRASVERGSPKRAVPTDENFFKPKEEFPKLLPQGISGVVIAQSSMNWANFWYETTGLGRKQTPEVRHEASGIEGALCTWRHKWRGHGSHVRRSGCSSGRPRARRQAHPTRHQRRPCHRPACASQQFIGSPHLSACLKIRRA